MPRFFPAPRAVGSAAITPSAMPPSTRGAEAASSRRNGTGRHLFGIRSEPAALMLGACSRSALAVTLGALAAVGFVDGWELIYPLLPATLLGMAVTTAFRVEHFFCGMRDYECRVACALGTVADQFARETAALRLHLAAATRFQNTGELEGAPVGAGAEPGTDEALRRTVPGNVVPLFPSIKL